MWTLLLWASAVALVALRVALGAACWGRTGRLASRKA